MKYEILEDCSPFYIRFTFDGLKDVVNLATKIIPEKVSSYRGYQHEFFNRQDARRVFSMLPMSNVIDFRLASVFTTPPDGGCGVHKDGLDHKVSYNIPLQVLDDQCVTTWYDDSQFENVEVRTLGGYTRNVFHDWRALDQLRPVKSVVARPGEMLLFNTDIYHAWYNKSPTNTRKMLLLRSVNPELLSFEQVKSIIGL